MPTTKPLTISVIYNPPAATEEQDADLYFAERDAGEMAQSVADSLQKSGYAAKIYQVSEKNLYYLKHKKADAFFNVCDGEHLYMKVVRQLEKAKRTFTGPGSEVMKLTTDKVETKKVFVKIGVPTPKSQFFKSANEPVNPLLQYPLIVKPPNEDCSIGITTTSIMQNEEELKKQIAYVCETYKQGALVEEFIAGKEINCTIVGNGRGVTVFPLAELQLEKSEIPEDYVFDYDAKWVGEDDRCLVKFVSPAASVPAEIQKQIQHDARKAFVALGMKDYARFDIRYNPHTKEWFFLEVNANPSIQDDLNEPTVTSAQAHGFRYQQFITHIMEECRNRYKKKLD